MNMVTPENRHKTGQQTHVAGSEATRWKPGQSGNPGGRPKTAPLSHAYRDKLGSPVPDDPQGRTYAQAIADTMADRALAGDIRAAQELADRAEGRARRSIDLQSATLREAFERLSNEELEAYATTGKLPEWFPQGEQANEPTR